MAMRWRVLGPVGVTVPGQVLLDRRPQQRGLLAYLLLNADRPVSTGQVVEALWGATPPPTARTQVHANVSRIRRALRDHDLDDVLTSHAGCYRLDVEPGELDLREFFGQVAAARAAAKVADLSRAAELLRQALGHWQGEALTGAAGAFVKSAAVRLQEQRLLAWEELADIELELGRHAALSDDLHALVAANPLRERLVARLMLTLAATGQQAQALGLYATTRAQLADELGVEPGRELAEAHLQVLRQQLPGPPPARPGSGPDPPRPAVARALPARLPADLPVFVGRAPQLRQLDTLLPDASSEPARAVAITGLAGVGKTALAVRWAHRIAHRFPDGQLYADLRGFDPMHPPADPADVLRGFLDALGVPADQLPASLAARAGLYRSRLAGRRVLIVLDNARDPDQVRGLLPGTPGCLAVLTSRHQLTNLVATDAVHPILLEPLSQDEARQLLVGRLGADRIAAEPEAVDEIVARSGRLPLALSIVAARAATRPSFPISSLAQELSAAPGSLGSFAGGDPRIDLRAVFASSYQALSPAAAALFRRLGQSAAADLTRSTAAGLAGLPERETQALLAELTQANLVGEHLPGRFSVHRLLRAYATELTHRPDASAQRRRRSRSPPS